MDNKKIVLFVCTGNTCRSPIAAAYANEIFLDRGLCGRALSCGIMAANGAAASRHSLKIIKDICGDASFEHKAQRANADILNNAHMVVALSSNHERYLLEYYPEFAQKIYTLGVLANADDNGDVSDPFGFGLDVYIEVAAQIKGLLDNLDWEKYL